jgi:hypothetical protein
LTDDAELVRDARENARWLGQWRALMESYIQSQVDSITMLGSMQASISELDSYEAKLRRYVKVKDIAGIFDRPAEHLEGVIQFLATHHDTWLTARAAAAQSAISDESDQADDKFALMNKYIEELRDFIKQTSGQGNVSYFQVLSLERLNRKVPGRDYARRVRESTLTMLVAETELFASRLTRRFIEERPGLLLADEVKLGWREIQNYSDVSELQDLLITRKTDEISAKSFDDFNDWFAKQVGPVDLDVSIVDLINDATQLRHAIIHSGSRITERALTQLRGDRFRSKDLLGKRLPLTSSDLDSFARAQIAYSFALWMMTMAKLAKSNEERAGLVFSAISEVQVLLLEKQLFEPILWTRNLVDRNVTSSRDVDIAFVNSCLARAQSGDETYKAEVESWDCSDKGEVLQLVKLVLQGDVANAEVKAEGLIKRGEMPKRHLFEWPVFEPLRSI